MREPVLIRRSGLTKLYAIFTTAEGLIVKGRPVGADELPRGSEVYGLAERELIEQAHAAGFQLAEGLGS